MSTSNSQTDVVIVGGGLAGLSTASYLARAGLAVTLFEKSSSLGGRAVTQQYDGYLFNRGGHALYQGGAATQVLRELNIPYSGHSPTASFTLSGGKIQILPTDPFTLLRSDLLSAAEKLELGHLFLSLPRLKPEQLAHMTVREWLEENIKHPHLRQVFTAFARTVTYSAALDRISAQPFVAQTQLAFKKPVLYIDGGWQSLVNELRRAAERAGARIVSGAHVERVLYQDGRVEGVSLRDGETVRAGAVVIAAGPRDASALVDGGAHPVLSELARRIVPVEVACLDVALRCLPPAPHYRAVFDLEKPRFMAFQSLTVKIAPAGGGLIHTFKYLDPAHPTDPREDERDLENLLDSAQPGWRDQEVRRVYLPRMNALNMFVSAADGGLSGRPNPEVAGIGGLYLAGDWIGSEGYLVDSTLASARQVARLLLGKRELVAEARVPARAGVV
jgi:phytoene dehydrogenase-like protein